MYSGETTIKRFVRASLYLSIRRYWKSTKTPKGKVLALCGKEYADIEPIKHLLGVPEEDIVLVDNREKQALLDAKAKYPRIETYYGNVLDVLDSNTFSFLNLDFCGSLTSLAENIIAKASKSLESNGVTSVTYIRGRDSINMALATVPDKKSIRPYFYSEVLKDCYRGVKAEYATLFSVAYTKPKPSFGVIAGIKNPVGEFKKFNDVLLDTTPTFKASNADALASDLANELYQDGFSVKKISNIMNLQLA